MVVQACRAEAGGDCRRSAPSGGTFRPFADRGDSEPREIIDIRHRIIHGYEGVDYRLLWDILQDDIPPLQERIRSEMEALRAELNVLRTGILRYVQNDSGEDFRMTVAARGIRHGLPHRHPEFVEASPDEAGAQRQAYAARPAGMGVPAGLFVLRIDVLSG